MVSSQEPSLEGTQEILREEIKHGQSPSRGSPLEEMATHSRILAWRIPWTEESGGLQFMESQRVGHD